MKDDEFEGKIDAKGKLELYRPFWERLKELASAPEVSRRLSEALGKRKALGWYDIRDYDLSIAREDEVIRDFPSGGDCLLIISITSGATVSLKFDSPNSDAFDLTEYRRIRHSFDFLYLTNSALSGAAARLLFAKGDFDLSLAIETKSIGPGEETEMSGGEIVVLLEALTGNDRLSADAIRNGDTNKVFTAAEKIKLATGVNIWSLLTGSLDNEQYVPFKNVAGVIKEILKVNDADETELRSAGEDIVVHVPQEGKSVKIVKEYF